MYSTYYAQKIFVDGIDNKLEGMLKHWSEFEEELDGITKWFRATEALFREQQLQASLEQKQEQLETLKKKRLEITDKEKVVDTFVDKSHMLLHSSGADRIKPLISQISNR